MVHVVCGVGGGLPPLRWHATDRFAILMRVPVKLKWRGTGRGCWSKGRAVRAICGGRLDGAVDSAPIAAGRRRGRQLASRGRGGGRYRFVKKKPCQLRYRASSTRCHVAAAMCRRAGQTESRFSPPMGQIGRFSICGCLNWGHGKLPVHSSSKTPAEIRHAKVQPRESLPSVLPAHHRRGRRCPGGHVVVCGRPRLSGREKGTETRGRDPFPRRLDHRRRS